jgi:DNA mismatch repair protein MutL
MANTGAQPKPPATSPVEVVTQRERTDDAEVPIGTRIDIGAEHAPRINELPLLRVVGQLGLTYIVAEGPAGMFLIDQHAAHERVLYERLLAAKAQAQIATQALLQPLTVELTAEGASLVEESLEALLELGFDLEPFGGNTVLVRAVPALLVGENIQATFDEIIADLQVGDDPLASEVEARIMRRVCKQAAIKAGQKLSHQEMNELIRQLEACASPRTCPHGRPTMIHLGAEQLAQEFGRLG